MGQNIILNMNDHGYVVCAFNRTVSKVDDFLANEAKGTNVIGAHSLEEMVSLLKRPRRVMLLVKAGKAVDEFINHLIPLLEPGDIIIDGGNSYFEDTVRRYDELKAKGILFVGSGVSGGEEGARHGPSLMPGGAPEAWPHIKAIFQSIAAKVQNGVPCCDWVGSGGAGHFVKMVHNGIEYGDMQLICEAYQLLSVGLGLTNEQLADTFTQVEPGRARFLPDRDHGAYFQVQGRPGRRLPDRQDRRCRRAEGHGQVDRPFRPGQRRAGDADRGGRLRAHHLLAQGRARGRLDRARRPERRQVRRRRAGRDRGHPPGALRLEDHLLRAGLHAAEERVARPTSGTSTSAAWR